MTQNNELERGNFFYYFGKDNEFFRQLEKFLDRVDKHSVSARMLDSSDFYRSWKFFDQKISCIFFDLYSLSQDLEKFSKTIRFYKNSDIFKGTVFIGIFNSVEQLQDNLYLFSHGLNYSFIKKDYYYDLFRDSFLITFETFLNFPMYAKAKDLNVEYHLRSLNPIGWFSKNKILIESDQIGLLGKFDTIVHPEDEDVEIQMIKDSGKNTCAYFPLTTQVIARHQFFENKEKNSTTLRKRFEELIDLDVIQNTETNILILDTMATFLADKEFELKYNHLNFHYVIKPENINSNFFKEANPECIFISTNTGNLSIKNLKKLIDRVKKIEEYKPVICIFNTLTNTEALRKVLEYRNIIGTKEMLIPSLVYPLIDSYFSKINFKDKTRSNKLMFNPATNNSLVKFKPEVIVTSLSEHSMTFYSQSVFPCYSILELDYPCNLILIIVPPWNELTTKAHHRHYMGIFHGLNFEEKSKLRVLGNQLIQNPTMGFEKIIEEEPVVVETVKKEGSKNPVEKIEDFDSKEIEIFEVKRKDAYDTGSKL